MVVCSVKAAFKWWCVVLKAEFKWWCSSAESGI